MTRHPLALALALLALAAARPAGADEQLVDGIAAQVGSEVVLVSEVRHASAAAEAAIREQGGTAGDVAKVRSMALERLIDTALVRQVVRRSELSATPADVDKAIEGIARNNGMDVDGVRRSVEAQGLSWDDYRSRIQGEIENSKVVNGMVGSRVRVDEKEVRAEYEKELGNQPKSGEEYLIRHLLVEGDAGQPEAHRAACEKVADAHARIVAGESFGQVASEVSEVDQQTGGLVGWVHVTALAAWMKPTIQSLEPGKVSDVVEMPFGCNLFLVEQRREYQPVSYDDAKALIQRKLWNERMEKEYAKFLDELRKQTYIERKGVFADAVRLDPSLQDPARAAAPAKPF